MARGVVIKSHANAFIKMLDKEMNRRLNKVGELVASKVRRNLSKSGRASGPSQPGESPHAQTGLLRKSIGFNVTGHTLRVGTPVEYAKFLEDGTVNMEARPFLLKTAKQMQSRIKRELTKPIKR